MTAVSRSRSVPHYTVGTTDAADWKLGHPLSVDGCLVMLCVEGSIDLTINSRRLSMSQDHMAFIVFDMVAVPVCVSDGFSAKYISIDFDTSQDIFFLVTSNRFWDYIYACPVFRLRTDIKEVTHRWFAQLDWLIENCSSVTAGKSLRNEMENFVLVMAEQVESHLGSLGVDPPKNRAWVIVNEFLGLLNRYYAHRHNVAFYADRLHINPNYLNIIAKKNLGVTAKEMINIQLGLVVKMLLDTTDLSVKEIAGRMHYDDPSYLCRVFRKQTGMSPIQYRNMQRDNR